MILVTGATGHTGLRLVKALLDEGEKVRVLTREPLRIPAEMRRRLSLLRGNLVNPEDARDAMDGCSTVVAMTHVKFASYIIAAMQATGVRRGIFTSSTRRFSNYPEETARQVIAGEEAVRASGLDYTILRPSMIYGGPQDNNLEHLVQFLKKWSIHPLVNGGTMRWQPVFTWDVVRAIQVTLKRDTTIGREYTLAGPEPVSYREMVETIGRQLGRKPIFVPVPINAAKPIVSWYEKHFKSPRVRLDQILRLQEDKVFDISDAMRDLDFNPVSFEEGIRRKLAGTA